MLKGLDPLLTGALLQILDEMGHSDSIVVTDAHFPAAALGARVLVMPGVSAPALVRAICSVLPLDTPPVVMLMTSAAGVVLPVQRELLEAAGVTDSGARSVERLAYYREATSAYAVIRSGDTRTYANALLSKGVVEDSR